MKTVVPHLDRGGVRAAYLETCGDGSRYLVVLNRSRIEYGLSVDLDYKPHDPERWELPRVRARGYHNATIIQRSSNGQR